MRKHLRDAIKLAGVKPDSITKGRSGHFHLKVGSKVVTAPGTPRCHHVAVIKIAGNLRKAAMAKGVTT